MSGWRRREYPNKEVANRLRRHSRAPDSSPHCNTRFPSRVQRVGDGVDGLRIVCSPSQPSSVCDPPGSCSTLAIATPAQPNSPSVQFVRRSHSALDDRCVREVRWWWRRVFVAGVRHSDGGGDGAEQSQRQRQRRAPVWSGQMRNAKALKRPTTIRCERNGRDSRLRWRYFKRTISLLVSRLRAQ